MTERAPASAGDGSLRFDPPTYLAPMEGVTDRSFRTLVAEISGGGALGAACTEFLRVTREPLPVARIVEELGPPVPGVPVGVQLMGNVPGAVAESAARAVEAGAPFVDLNFGCPAPRVYQHCAGSALLDDPPLLERMVRAVVERCSVPVTAKIRAGGEDDRHLLEIARRIEDAGAAALTVHARLRVTSYREPSRWEWIRAVKEAVRIPVIGNGSAETAGAMLAMREATGCDAVMVGRGALGNPWIFRDWAALRSGRAPQRATPGEVRAWLATYDTRMRAGGATPRQALGRLKQAAKALTASGLVAPPDLRAVLRSQDAAQFTALLFADAEAAA